VAEKELSPVGPSAPASPPAACLNGKRNLLPDGDRGGIDFSIEDGHQQCAQRTAWCSIPSTSIAHDALGNVAWRCASAGMAGPKPSPRRTGALERVHLPTARPLTSAAIGGQQQRVPSPAPTRSNRGDPVDEPPARSTPNSWAAAGGDARAARDGMTMVVVSHDMGFAKAAADRVVFRPMA